jgi:hypothetical protein
VPPRTVRRPAFLKEIIRLPVAMNRSLLHHVCIAGSRFHERILLFIYPLALYKHCVIHRFIQLARALTWRCFTVCSSCYESNRVLDIVRYCPDCSGYSWAISPAIDADVRGNLLASVHNFILPSCWACVYTDWCSHTRWLVAGPRC